MKGRDNNDHNDGSNDDDNNNNNQSADRSNPLVNRFRCLNIADGIVRPFNTGSRQGHQGRQGPQGRQGHQGHASAANRKTMESKLEVRLVSLYGLVGLAAISRHLGPAFRSILLDDPQRVPRVAMAVGVDRRVFMMNQPRVLEDEGYSSSTEDLAGKYDKEVAAQCMRWLKMVTEESLDTSGEMDSVYEQLKDGYVLCKLVDKIDPGCIPASKLKARTGMTFKQMEMIELFNTKIKGPPLKIPEHSVFATADLYEKQNMVQVITCIESVARRCLNDDIRVEGFGPKESAGNKREFTEEQLAQGKNIIGLQMGSNKGASQAGQNFGKSRMIVD